MITKAEWRMLGRFLWASQRNIIVGELLGIGLFVSALMVFLTNEIAFYIVSAALLLGNVADTARLSRQAQKDAEPLLTTIFRFWVRTSYVFYALLAIGLFVGVPLYHHLHG